jgi:hypothetical protein
MIKIKTYAGKIMDEITLNALKDEKKNKSLVIDSNKKQYKQRKKEEKAIYNHIKHNKKLFKKAIKDVIKENKNIITRNYIEYNYITEVYFNDAKFGPIYNKGSFKDYLTMALSKFGFQLNGYEINIYKERPIDSTGNFEFCLKINFRFLKKYREYCL